MLDDLFVALDVETTGLDASQDEVIEVGAVKFRGDVIVDTFSTLVKPGKHIDLVVQQLTGLDDTALADAPRFAAVAPMLRDFVRTTPIVGQSIGFDLGMLEAAGLRFINARYDTFELATILMPELSTYNLSSIAQALGVEMSTAHRALADAETTMRVFNKLVDRADQFETGILQQLADTASQSGTDVAYIFRSLLRKRDGSALPSPRGTELPTSILPVEHLLVPVERTPRLEPTGSVEPIDLNVMNRAMAPDGPFAQSVEGFELRPQQVQMMRHVAQTLNDGGQLLVEAGTGTGKSLAYLLPAALHAIERGETVVVSTATIALQDQLITKDIPKLLAAGERARAADPDDPLAHLAGLTATVLKGRANYLCLRRWFQLQREPPTSQADAQLRTKIIAWLPQTVSGDSAELQMNLEQRLAWGRYAEVEGSCDPRTCQFARNNQCFLMRARQQAEGAHIVVVNHSLLISDLMTGQRVIPTYHALIVDEAHHLEDEATAQGGFTLSLARFRDAIDRITSAGGSDGAPGTVQSVFRHLAASELESTRAEAEALRPLVDQLPTLAADAHAMVSGMFGLLTEFAERFEDNSSGYDRQSRIQDGTRRDPNWVQVEMYWDDALQAIAKVVEANNAAKAAWSRTTIVDDDEDEDVGFSLVSAEEQLLGPREQMTGFISQPDRDTIYWLSRRQQSDETNVNAAPLHVGDLLQGGLFERCDSVVLTSATLTTDSTFDYIRDRLSVWDADELLVSSPFDFQRAALVAVVDDIPEPNQHGHQRALQEAVLDLCLASRGRAMVLFTSHNALLTTYRAIKPQLEDAGIMTLGQRVDGNPRQLIERLKANPNTVILGTNSFWEGVDVVGEALSLLIVTKLPFPVPSDPVFAARSELFDNPFMDYAVPQAILRFKQGFGRLIRSGTDRGVCVVLDRRVVARRYGEAFINSLPASRFEVGSTAQIADAVAEFLDNA